MMMMMIKFHLDLSVRNWCYNSRNGKVFGLIEHKPLFGSITSLLHVTCFMLSVNPNFLVFCHN